MSSFTFADNKLGGRLTAACDAIAAAHLNRAAGILAELADEINVEATQAGLLADEGDVTVNVCPVCKGDAAVCECEPSLPLPPPAQPQTPQLTVSQAPVDLQMCARGVHSFGAPDLISGWRTCASCQMVNVAPPEGGPIDMSARQ